MAGKVKVNDNGKVGVNASGKVASGDCSECCGCDTCVDSCDNCDDAPQNLLATLDGFPDNVCVCSSTGEGPSDQSIEFLDSADGSYVLVGCDESATGQLFGVGDTHCQYRSTGNETIAATFYTDTATCESAFDPQTPKLWIAALRCDGTGCDAGKKRWRVWVWTGDDAWTNFGQPAFFLFYGEACTETCQEQVVLSNQLVLGDGFNCLASNIVPSDECGAASVTPTSACDQGTVTIVCQ